MHRFVLSCVTCLALIGCVASPDLPPADRQARGDVPRLVPISGLLAQAAPQREGLSAVNVGAAPIARAAQLRARAASLRGPVIAPSDRARLLASGPRLR